MENDEAKKAREAAEGPIAEALNFLMNSWRQVPALRSAIDRAIGCLKGGDASDQAHAELLQAYLAYPGSTAAQQAAFRLHKGIRTPEGRTAAGLPRRARKKEHDLSSISVTDALFQTLLHAEESDNWPDIDTRLAFENHFGEHLSPATRKRLMKELKQRVKNYAENGREFKSKYDRKMRFI